MNLRSIVPKTVLWLAGTVIFVLIGFMATAHLVATRVSGIPAFVKATQQLQLETAVQILDQDGPAALKTYLNQLDLLYRGRHFLVDRENRDILSRESMANLAKRAQPVEHGPEFFGNEVVFERQSEDGNYRLLIELPRPISSWDVAFYFVWIIVVIVALGYGFAVHIVRPLKQLQNAVVQLGAGQLSTRVAFQRQDEFGELGRAFDKMAHQIESLLKAERLLLQDISHELRSPLTRLRFALDLARSNVVDNSSFQRVDREVSRLSALIGQLLQLTRAEGDVTASNRIEMSLSDQVTESIHDFQLEAAAKNCNIKRTSVASQIRLCGDPELIRRSIENVLSNAIRHSPSESQILVDLTQAEETARISIRDYGTGVPDEMLTEIFKPFRRVECDRNRDSGGVGLGLSIALRAVHLHHGTIVARNANPGLEVVIELPIAHSDPET